MATHHRATGYLAKHMRVIAKRYWTRRSSRAGLSEERVLVQSGPTKPLATGDQTIINPNWVVVLV